MFNKYFCTKYFSKDSCQDSLWTTLKKTLSYFLFVQKQFTTLRIYVLLLNVKHIKALRNVF